MVGSSEKTNTDGGYDDPEIRASNRFRRLEISAGSIILETIGAVRTAKPEAIRSPATDPRRIEAPNPPTGAAPRTTLPHLEDYGMQR